MTDLIDRAHVASAIQYHVTDDDDRNTLSRAIADLPAVTMGVKPRKSFPILKGEGARIDYQLVADHAEQARSNHYQSVDWLAERGGLSWFELYAVLHNRKHQIMDTNEAMIACRLLEARYLAALTPTPVDASQATDPAVNAPDPAAIRIADEVCDFFDAKGQHAEAFGAAEVGQRLRDVMQTDPAAIREAALREAAQCAINNQDCSPWEISDAILALIAKGAAE